jgi:hypothetical protein
MSSHRSLSLRSGRQARRKLEGRDGFAPDFAAVFHDQDPKRVGYMDVAGVEKSRA